MTARQRLAVFANVSRMQSDQETYDMAVNRDVELKRQRVRAERAEAERDGLRFHLGRRGKSTMPEIVSLTIRIRELEAERDALLALLRECHDRFVDAYGPDGRFTRKIGAAIDAALGERDE